MKLQRKNNFKQMVISKLSKASLIAGIGVLGLVFLPNAIDMIKTTLDSNKQTDIVTEAINPEYDQTNQNINLDENYVITEETSKYNFQKLKETNQNITAVIEGSCFDGGYYPIVQTNNNDEMNYYLKHTVDNQQSSLGTIFTDCNNKENDQVQRIWGHNFNNGANTMFTGLANTCQNQQTFDETIGQDGSLKLYTEDGEYDLEVFACVINNPTTQPIGTYNDQNQFLNDMENAINNSLIQTDTQVNENDQVLILTTCTDIGSSKDPNNRISVYCKKTPTLIKEMNQGKTL